MNEGLLTKRHQLEALRKAAVEYPKLKIGSSYVSLLKYEQRGILLPPKNKLAINDKEWRFYTREEIAANVQRVIDFKKQALPVIRENGTTK